MSDLNDISREACWYVVHTYSGYENKVKANLEKIVENRGLQHLIFDSIIPVETVKEGEGEDGKEVENKIFPSYVLIKMIMSDESWHVVRNTTGVTGFVGPGSQPVVLPDEEVEQLGVDTDVQTLDFALGDVVEIIGGPFQGVISSGKVLEISDDMKQVKLLVSIGGRESAVEFDATWVKKL
jgi:transcriptional antiterminator NusG